MTYTIKHWSEEQWYNFNEKDIWLKQMLLMGGKYLENILKPQIQNAFSFLGLSVPNDEAKVAFKLLFYIFF